MAVPIRFLCHYAGELAGGVAMRLLCACAIAAALSLLPFGIDGGGASLQAKIVCGNFGQGFTCKSDSGPGQQYGKNAIPGAPPQAPEPSPPAAMPEGSWPAPAESGQGAAGPAPDPTACQHGMVGTPPDNCRCPTNSELLGGNCVHYTASACSNGLAADGLPQACRGAEEKLSCTLRQDGLKDCCCVTYDKF
jgi:hypothetical protein